MASNQNKLRNSFLQDIIQEKSRNHNLLTRSPRAKATKIWGFQFRIESGKGCWEKKIAHSYSEFEKKSNGVFSGFLSLIDPEIF